MNTERTQILNDLVREKNIFIRFDTTVGGNLSEVLRYLAEAGACVSRFWPDGKPGDLCSALRIQGLRHAYIKVYLSTTPRYTLWEEEPEKGHTLFDHVNHLIDLEGPRPTRAHIVCQNETVRFLMLKLLERVGYENCSDASGLSDQTTVINVERRKIVSLQTPNVDRPGMEIQHPLSDPGETLRKLSLLVDPLPELPPLPRVWGKCMVYDHQKDGFDLEPGYAGYTVYTPTLRKVHDLMHGSPCVTDVTLSLGGITKREYLLSRTKVQQMLKHAAAVKAHS